MNAIEVNHLSRKFNKFSAVDDISFTIPKGEIFGLLGPNGAGKTTTIRILCGIMLPSAGSVNVLGYDVTRHPNEVKSQIGYMSQKFSLYNDLTPVENIMFYASIYGMPKKEQAKRIGELIEMSGLTNHQKQLTRTLSGAWRQRLALACAIVHQPAMLFLDEATAGVDPISRREFWDLIYSLAGEGMSVLATTHYMDEAEYCNMIGMMNQGKMIALASPESLKNDLPGTLIQLDCSNPGKAIDLLSTLSGVLGATIHGALVHLTLENPNMEAFIKTNLTKAGIKIKNWEMIQPSLEDVFLGMVFKQPSNKPIQDHLN
jgi:ABC-2 type transport system ATP-binding protein